jgi:predicted enzyme related to lactoylglutathione lyase
MIKITIASVFVEDQQKALEFYTNVLGFAKKVDIPVGGARWLTVGSPSGPEIDLLLEPNANPIAKAYQQGIYEAGIPATTFAADDVRAEYERMKQLGVVFTAEPAETGGVIGAVFDDTCGNLIGLHQVLA